MSDNNDPVAAHKARKKAAYARLDDVVRELVQITEIEHGIDNDPDRLMPTDYILVVGCQFIDNDGDRNGSVLGYPRDGYQPRYITEGLLVTALKR